jgi:hypothetical protein
VVVLHYNGSLASKNDERVNFLVGNHEPRLGIEPRTRPYQGRMFPLALSRHGAARLGPSTLYGLFPYGDRAPPVHRRGAY